MEKKVLTAKDSALSFVLAFAFSQIAVMVFVVASSFLAGRFGMDTASFQKFLDTALGYFLTMLVLDITMVFVFFCFNFEKQNKIVGKLDVLKVLLYVDLAIVCFILLYPIISCCDKLFVKMGAKISNLPYRLTLKNYIFSIFSLALIPAICEELIFRGLIFKGLVRYGKVFSIVTSAVMFAIFHMSYQQLIYPLLMGLFLGVIMYNENNIIYTIIAHFTNNFLSLTMSYLRLNKYSTHWAFVLLAIVLLAVFLFCIIYYIACKKESQPKEKLEPAGKKYLIASFAVMIFLWVIVNIFNR